MSWNFKKYCVYFIMACKSCKQKKELMSQPVFPNEDKFDRTSNLVEKWIPWFLLVWSLFAIYGIFKFVELIISLFK